MAARPIGHEDPHRPDSPDVCGLRLGPQHVQPRCGRGHAAFTGTEYFPGGSSQYTLERGTLIFEFGPSTDVTLEWATYFDAADQAEQSRLFGGIHIQADDFTGRIIGSDCGQAAWRLAWAYFAGSVPDTSLGSRDEARA